MYIYTNIQHLEVDSKVKNAYDYQLDSLDEYLTPN